MAKEPLFPRGYLQGLGLVTASWAMFETAIDFIVAITFSKLGAPPGHKEVPRSMDRKITYLRDLVKAGQLNPEWLTEISKIADEAVRLKSRRHDAIHGALSAAKGHEVQLFRVIYEKTQHRSTDVVVSARSFVELAKETGVAAGLCLPLIVELAKASKEPLDDLFSE